MLIDFKDEDFDNKIKNEEVSVIQFSAAWCGPCKALKPRMELYVDPKFADKIISISHSFDIEAKIIGRVEKSKSKKLSIKSEFGEFNY